MFAFWEWKFRTTKLDHTWCGLTSGAANGDCLQQSLWEERKETFSRIRAQPTQQTELNELYFDSFNDSEVDPVDDVVNTVRGIQPHDARNIIKTQPREGVEQKLAQYHSSR